MKGTNKSKEYTGTYLICFNTHRGLSQSEGNKCMWTHSKDGKCNKVKKNIIDPLLWFVDVEGGKSKVAESTGNVKSIEQGHIV